MPPPAVACDAARSIQTGDYVSILLSIVGGIALALLAAFDFITVAAHVEAAHGDRVMKGPQNRHIAPGIPACTARRGR